MTLKLYEFPGSPHCLKIRAVAHELGVRLDLTTVERESLVGRATSRADARTACLLGRGFLATGREANAVDAAIEALNGGVNVDPAYAAARASLGMAWRAKYLRSRDGESWDRAQAACAEAARLQPGHSEAHTCLGMLLHARRRCSRLARP